MTQPHNAQWNSALPVEYGTPVRAMYSEDTLAFLEL